MLSDGVMYCMYEPLIKLLIQNLCNCSRANGVVAAIIVKRVDQDMVRLQILKLVALLVATNVSSRAKHQIHAIVLLVVHLEDAA